MQVADWKKLKRHPNLTGLLSTSSVNGIMAKAKFTISVKEDFDGLSMQRALSRLDDRMKRQALRRIAAKSGSVLAKEIRKQIKQRDMPYSRKVNEVEARKKTGPPLDKTIKVRQWSKFEKGLVGAVVGPEWKTAKHGHLVEFGHRVQGRFRVKFRAFSLRSLLRGKFKLRNYRLGRRKVQGGMTIAHHFQEDAGEAVKHRLFAEQRTALGQWMRKQRAKGKL